MMWSFDYKLAMKCNQRRDILNADYRKVLDEEVHHLSIWSLLHLHLFLAAKKLDMTAEAVIANEDHNVSLKMQAMC